MSLGFYFDMNRCFGCRVCQVACKDRLGLEEAGPRPRRVQTYTTGTYPNAMLYHASISCNHCEAPACVANCPTGAMYKDENGLVLHDDNTCIGCKTCVASCPYGAPQYSEEKNLIVKCDTCAALRENGMNPVCVDACIGRAIEFGDIEELKSRHGDALVSEIAVTGEAVTEPNLLINPKEAALQEDCKETII